VGATDSRVVGAGTHVLSVTAGNVDDARRPGLQPALGLPKVEADEAWNVTTGSENIVVGVDTGIDANRGSSGSAKKLR
jgi:hypothetical protein